MGDAWDLIVFNPMLNGLIALSSVLFHNFGLAVVVLTVAVRGLMFPLTLKQLHASRKMSELGPKMQDLQKRYSKDQEKLTRETAKLYKESGVSPTGCMLPMLIQMPIWIALYQSVMRALATTPEALADLSTHLYSWQMVHQAIPLGEHFLWLNLSQPDPYLIILPVLVGGTMWVQQKMATIPTSDPKQQATSRMMLWMMPVMFAFMTMQFPSGLSIYWVVSNVIGIVIQYFVTGWGSLAPSAGKQLVAKKVISDMRISEADDEDIPAPAGKKVEYGKSRDKRKDSRGSRRARSGAARSRSEGSGSRSRKRK